MGIKGKRGSLQQLNLLLFLLLNLHFSLISCMVLAPSSGSLIDHCNFVFDRSLFWHLHQMQDYCALADSIPQMVTKNFQSPLKK